MKCTSPLRILNPKKDMTYRDKVWLTVPCGKCENCRKHNRNEWFVRMFFEWQHCKDELGTCLFPTLTYNNDHLPLFNNVPVFNKNHIQLFLKRLRKYLKRLLGVDCLRFICCSEYGGETARPHYHCLLFIYYPRLYFSMKKQICEYIDKAWSDYNGFVMWSKKGYEIKSTRGILYVSKYISKDMYFPFHEFDDVHKDILNNIAPFHVQSQHFGEYMLDKLGLKDISSQTTFRLLVDGTILIPSVSKGGKVKDYIYGVPQYVTKKILYDYKYEYVGQYETIDEDTGEIKKKSLANVSYIVNELGLAVKKEKEFHSIEFRQQEFDRILNSIENILPSFSEDDIKYILDSNNITYKNNDLSSLLEYLENTWYSYSLVDKQNCILYLDLFKDRVVLPNCDFIVNDICSGILDARLYLDELYRLDCPVMSADDDVRFADSKLDLIKYRMSMNTFAHSLDDRRYNDYEILSQIFNSIMVVIGLHTEQALKEAADKEANKKCAYNCTV